MSSCPGACGSTVSTSKVGAGLVVEDGGAVVGGAVVLVNATVVVTAGGWLLVVATVDVDVIPTDVDVALEGPVVTAICSVDGGWLGSIGVSPPSRSLTALPQAIKMQPTANTPATDRQVLPRSWIIFLRI